jgi:hypothetical protein
MPRNPSPRRSPARPAARRPAGDPGALRSPGQIRELGCRGLAHAGTSKSGHTGSGRRAAPRHRRLAAARAPRAPGGSPGRAPGRARRRRARSCGRGGRSRFPRTRADDGRAHPGRDPPAGEGGRHRVVDPAYPDEGVAPGAGLEMEIGVGDGIGHGREVRALGGVPVGDPAPEAPDVAAVRNLGGPGVVLTIGGRRGRRRCAAAGSSSRRTRSSARPPPLASGSAGRRTTARAWRAPSRPATSG